ncbi:MAG: DUF2680 domain-containing protein [Bacillota bacterium]|uniref:DUF2680 domain-containing protein n=1 Tax=Thermanaerosceptrum fracticalcis TaxID=1712410 RepID=A0A7G6DYS0_THEFR|nr:DUF2680 domain-containing protein [Thermanaerosceptrum fracticalcis]QNB44974.1 DUF2680 domain-containing protein [Thermanaerosceptrum fracticalcis]QNB44988.1 DUF2680 domain-containing protein [Thermanaerosceptrum fracticalcis]
MKKRSLIILTVSLMVLFTTAVFAATYSNPAQIISGLTGKTEADVYAQRSQGKTFGQIAQENGVFDQFKSDMLQYKKEIIDQRVASGTITKEKGEAIKKALDERIAACTGTPDPNRDRLGQKFGGGLGFGKGQSRGMGRGMGMGQGMGFGR